MFPYILKATDCDMKIKKNGVDVMNSIRDFAHISHSEVRNCRAVMVMTSSVLGQIIFKIRPHDKWWSGQPLALIIIDL